MIRLACSIPREITIAVSGGSDSMSLLNFCIKGRKNITALYINHRTTHADEAQEVVAEYCRVNKVPLAIRYIPQELKHNELEWRNARLEFYKEFTSNGRFVATGATLDDAVEWWLMTSLHAEPKLMRPVDEEFRLLKPFLLTEKDELIKWCQNNAVPFVVDPTNFDGSNTRSVIRRDIIPVLLRLHPGLYTSIKRKLEETL